MLGTVSGWTAALGLVALVGAGVASIGALVWRIAKAATTIESAVAGLTDRVRKIGHEQKNDQQAITLLRSAVEDLKDDADKLDQRVHDLEIATAKGS